MIRFNISPFITPRVLFALAGPPARRRTCKLRMMMARFRKTEYINLSSLRFISLYIYGFTAPAILFLLLYRQFIVR